MKIFNHHHPITKEQCKADFGSGGFIADIEMIPLLKALNDMGLITRTHCCGHETGHSFVSILLDNVEVEVKNVFEIHSDRDFKLGQKELLIKWQRRIPLTDDEVVNMIGETNLPKAKQ